MSENIETTSLGTIVAFDTETQIATVELAYNDYNKNLVKNFNKIDNHILIDVPVELPRCNGFAITFEIKPGDDCVVTFFKEGICHWLYENRRSYKELYGLPEPCALRKFSKQDAICRVSVDNLMNTLSAYSDGLQLRNRAGNQTITLKANGDIIINTDMNIMANAGGNITATAGGNAVIDVQGSASISSPSSVSLNSGGTIDLTAAGALNLGAASINMSSSGGGMGIDASGKATMNVTQLEIV